MPEPAAPWMDPSERAPLYKPPITTFNWLWAQSASSDMTWWLVAALLPDVEAVRSRAVLASRGSWYGRGSGWRSRVRRSFDGWQPW